jgi:hypothetical protein
MAGFSASASGPTPWLAVHAGRGGRSKDGPAADVMSWRIASGQRGDKPCAPTAAKGRSGALKNTPLPMPRSSNG